jgi:hypothetical protein
MFDPAAMVGSIQAPATWGVGPARRGFSVSELTTKVRDFFREPGVHESAPDKVHGRYMGAAGLDLVATVIRLEPDVVVLEFEVPFDGFTIPGSGWRVAALRDGDPRQGTGRIERLRLVLEESSPAGPHAKGTLVRVELRSPGGGAIPEISEDSVVRFEVDHQVIRLWVRMHA